MLASHFELILGAGLLSVMFVFAAAFRFALRECGEARELACQPDIPRASIHDGDRRWRAGAHRQRALRGVTMLQAGFVAVGITSVFVMAVCMAGTVGLMIFG